MHERDYRCVGRLRQITLAALVSVCGACLLTAACGPTSPPATTPSPAPPTSAAPARPQAQPVPSSPTAAKPDAAQPGPAQPGAVSAVTPPATKPRPPSPPPLLGHLSRASLKTYESWKPLFAQPPYAPDPAAVTAIRSGAQDVTVLLIMATWCPDSKRELPRYFAIMDAAGVSDSTLTMVGVDRTKKDNDGLTDKWGITRVPTFVFFRGGQELGRVVERVPAGSTLEAEIARILGSK